MLPDCNLKNVVSKPHTRVPCPQLWVDMLHEKARAQHVGGRCKKVVGTAYPTNKRGFTLVEMLIAIGLSTIVFAMIGSAILTLSTTTTRGKTRTEHARLARAIIRQIETDFRSLEFIVPEDNESEDDSASSDSSADDSGTNTQTATSTEITETTPAISTIGLVGDASYVKISVGLPTGINTVMKSDATTVELSGRRNITYSLGENGAGLRRLQEDVSASSTGTLNIWDQMLAEEVKSLTIKYYDGSAWTDSWDAQTTALLPSAVEINVGIAFGDVVEAQQSYRYVIAIPLAKQFQSQLEGGL